MIEECVMAVKALDAGALALLVGGALGFAVSKCLGEFLDAGVGEVRMAVARRRRQRDGSVAHVAMAAIV